MIEFVLAHQYWLTAYWVGGTFFMWYFVWTMFQNQLRSDFGWFLATLILIPTCGGFTWPMFALFSLWNKFVRK